MEHYTPIMSNPTPRTVKDLRSISLTHPVVKFPCDWKDCKNTAACLFVTTNNLDEVYAIRECHEHAIEHFDNYIKGYEY